MISILFLLGLAQASDVYEICRTESQRWSDRYQKWETIEVNTYISYEPIQIIVHGKSFEVNRDIHPISSRDDKGKLSCFSEHQKSTICYDENIQVLYWDWEKKNGDSYRDIMSICKINGEAP